MNSHVGAFGSVSMRVTHREQNAPLAWKIRNTARLTFIGGLLANRAAFAFSKITKVPTITSKLMGKLIRADGTTINYGVLSYRLVTDAGVAHMVDDWQAGTPRMYDVMKYHACGTGTGDEAVGDTGMGTECTTTLNPDSTRATGTNTQPSAPVLQSVGTVTFDGSAAVTEHGLMSAAATGTGTLWDRSKFAAINVVSGDTIAFTYQCTIASGG